MRALACLLAFSLLVLPSVAWADAEDAENAEASYDPGKAERRSDFTAGVMLGLAAGSSSGSLNELERIGDPASQVRTGAAAGSSLGIWFGGALRDWLVFGLGVRSTAFEASGKRSEGAAFVLHLETYPLYARGGIFRDLALVGEFGLGGRKIIQNEKTVAEAGSPSEVSLGVHWEAFRFWTHFAGGPALVFTHEFSESLTTSYGVLAFRTAFYGGPG